MCPLRGQARVVKGPVAHSPSSANNCTKYAGVHGGVIQSKRRVPTPPPPEVVEATTAKFERNFLGSAKKRVEMRKFAEAGRGDYKAGFAGGRPADPDACVYPAYATRVGKNCDGRPEDALSPALAPREVTTR